MWKSSKSRAEQHFSGAKTDNTTIKQKEKVQREREDRVARLRELRLAKEAAEQQTLAPAGAPEPAAAPDAEEAPRLPKVHPHRS